jgi:oligopeptidase B
MKTQAIFFILLFICSLISNIAEAQQAPKATKKAKKISEHGQKRIDYYYWLSQEDNPKVIKYLNAENEYLKTVLATKKELQQKIHHELVSRIERQIILILFLSLMKKTT